MHLEKTSHDIVNAIESKLNLVHNKQETKTMKKTLTKPNFTSHLHQLPKRFIMFKLSTPNNIVPSI
jgi:hypothetical protein